MKNNTILCLFAATAFIIMSFTSCRNTIKQDEKSSMPTTTASPTVTTGTKPSDTDAPTTKPTTGSSKEQIIASVNRSADVAKLAASLIGKPYQYGAAGPDAFDNSGFLVYCFSQNGLTLPRKTGDIAKKGVTVDKKDLIPGDVVFFYNENPNEVEYAGIYIGNNQFAASNTEENPVSIHTFTIPYFEKRFLFARRYFESISASAGNLTAYSPEQILQLYCECLQKGDKQTLDTLFSKKFAKNNEKLNPQNIYNITIGVDKVGTETPPDSDTAYYEISFTIKDGDYFFDLISPGEMIYKFYPKLIREDSIWKIFELPTSPNSINPNK